MAIQEYAKQIPKVAKWNKDMIKVHAVRTANLDKARVMALRADNWLAARKPGWDKLNKQARDKNKTWISMAEEIVRLQKEQASARKSKDKSKVKSLEIEIKKINSYAERVVDDFTAIHQELTVDDKKLGEVIQALLKLGI